MPLMEYKYLETRLIFPFLLQETLGNALFSYKNGLRKVNTHMIFTGYSS